MEQKELIKVFIDVVDGKTICICPRYDKRCDKPCKPDIVERDRYRDWQKTFYQDKYGQSHIDD